MSEDSNQDIDDLHTSKPLKRGETYIKSKYILSVQDCAKSGHYLLKVKVLASYSATDNHVTVTLSQVLYEMLNVHLKPLLWVTVVM